MGHSRRIILDEGEVFYFDGLRMKSRPATKADQILVAQQEEREATVTATAVTDNKEDPKLTFWMSKAVEKAIESIHKYALKDALAPSDDEDEIMFSSQKDHHVGIPRHPSKGGKWGQQEIRTLEAAVKFYRSRMEAYRDNPVPFGKHRSDSSAWLNRFTSAIPAGRHREVLAEMPSWERHILEVARTSGRKILMPHPSHPENLPRFLRVEEITRRFGIDQMQAGQFQMYFQILELDAEAVEKYAAQVRRFTQPHLFKAEDLAKNPGTHPDVLLIQLGQLAIEVGIQTTPRVFESAYVIKRVKGKGKQQEEKVILLAPSEDALEQTTTPHYDTDMGAFDSTELELQIKEGESDPDIQSADLVFAEQVDEDEELTLDSDEDPSTEGAYEALSYHEQGHGDCEVDVLEGDPLYEQIRCAKGPEIPALKKALWTEQKQNSRSRKHVAWTYLWLILKARENGFRDHDPNLTDALRRLEVADTYRQVRKLGARIYSESKGWPGYSRKRFWSMYKERREDLETAAKTSQDVSAATTAAAA